MAKKEKPTKACSKCTKIKSLDEYYMASSDLISSDGKLTICKVCLESLITDYNNPTQFKNIMRSIDRPFLAAEYLGSPSSNPSNPQREYMKRLAMRQNRHLTWADSEFGQFVGTGISSTTINPNIDEEITRYWGNGYSVEEYEFLEDERHKLMSSFECPDYGMEMIMKDICFINLDIEKCRQDRKDNSGKVITELIKTRRDLMNDANMKPIQSTGAEASDQITFGTLIKKWENERPVPKKLDDDMKDYIDTFMIGHLAKMDGLNNDMTKKYDQALAKYTIDFDEINREPDEIED